LAQKRVHHQQPQSLYHHGAVLVKSEFNPNASSQYQDYLKHHHSESILPEKAIHASVDIQSKMDQHLEKSPA
jgi:hypothetical protein